MSDNSTPPIARPGPGAPPGGRRTKFMIEQENNRILDYVRSGATDRQIREWVGLTWRNYRKRIYMLQKQDLDQTVAEQSAQARAFTYQRILEKISNLEIKANQIMQSRTNSDRDKIEAMKFLLQLHEDEYSLKEFGPTKFLQDDRTLPPAYQQKALEYRAAFTRSREEAEEEPAAAATDAEDTTSLS